MGRSSSWQDTRGLGQFIAYTFMSAFAQGWQALPVPAAMQLCTVHATVTWSFEELGLGWLSDPSPNMPS